MSRRPYWQVLAVATVIVLGAAQAGRAAEVFIPITPCRVVNTRDVPADGPKVENRDARDFTVQGNCGVPVGAKAVAINVTVTEQEAQGFLTVFPSDLAFGVGVFHSNLNFPAVEFATDNGSIARLAATTPDLSVYWDSLPTSPPGTFKAHVLIDIFGYFAELAPTTISKAGTAAFAIGQDGINITFSSPMPSTGYAVVVQATNTAGYSPTSDCTYFNPLHKRVDGFEVQHKRCDDGVPVKLDVGVSFDWIVVAYE